MNYANAQLVVNGLAIIAAGAILYGFFRLVLWIGGC